MVRGRGDVIEIRVAENIEAEKPFRYIVEFNGTEFAINSDDGDCLATLVSEALGMEFKGLENGETDMDVSLSALRILDANSKILFNSLKKDSLFGVRGKLVRSQMDQLEGVHVDVQPFYLCLDPGIISVYEKGLSYVGSLFKTLRRRILHINGLVVEPISFHVGQQCGPSLPSTTDAMRMLPAVVPHRVETNKVEVKEYRGGVSGVPARLVNEGMVSVPKIMKRIVASSSITGAPFGWIERARDHARQTGAKSLSVNAWIEIVLRTCECFVDYASMVLRVLGDSERSIKNESDPIMWGFMSLYMAVLSGLNAVPKAAQKSHKDTGTLGLVYDVSLSLVQLLCNTGSGCLDVVSGFITYVRNSVDTGIPEPDFRTRRD